MFYLNKDKIRDFNKHEFALHFECETDRLTSIFCCSQNGGDVTFTSLFKNPFWNDRHKIITIQTELCDPFDGIKQYLIIFMYDVNSCVCTQEAITILM